MIWPMPPDTALIGTTEAARVIDCDKTTLTRWLAAGRITAAHKLPGKNGALLFTRAEVERVRDEYAASLAGAGGEA